MKVDTVFMITYIITYTLNILDRTLFQSDLYAKSKLF